MPEFWTQDRIDAAQGWTDSWRGPVVPRQSIGRVKLRLMNRQKVPAIRQFLENIILEDLRGLLRLNMAAAEMTPAIREIIDRLSEAVADTERAVLDLRRVQDLAEAEPATSSAGQEKSSP